MLKKIKKTIKKYNLFEKGEKLLLAVSGGPDSIALLDVMSRLEKYKLSVAHFNHLTRGAASDGDEVFVKEICRRKGIAFYSGSKDIKKLAKEQGMSFQNAAREARYEFLRTTAKEIGATKIVLAHHADDQVETVLLKLLRGSALKGLSGMAPLENDIARPMLEVTKEEIEQYILQEKLCYRLDASNMENLYSRNRLRNEVLPLLRKFNPALSNTIGNMTEIIAAEDKYLMEVTKEYFKIIVSKQTEEEIIFNLEQFNTLDIALKRRLILLALSSVAHTEKDFSYKHVEDIMKIAAAGSGLVIHLPHKLRAKTSYGKLHITKAEIPLTVNKYFNLELLIPGITEIEGVGEITAEYVQVEQAYSDAYTVYLHKKNVLLPFIVRSREPGDAVRLLGGKGKTKIKDYFIDMHIERELRDAIPIVVDASGEVIWIAGLRPGEKCRIEHGDKMLKLTYKPFHV